MSCIFVVVRCFFKRVNHSHLSIREASDKISDISQRNNNVHEKSETLLNLYHEKYLKDGKQRCKRAEIKLQSMPRDSFFLEPCRTFFGYYELTS